jgi:hypothetical protein
MASEVQICNLALLELGQAGITAFNEGSKPATLAEAFYEHTRDVVLAAHPWNFALVRAELALEVATPVWGFARQFQLPTDPLCLRVWRMDGEAEGLIWKVEGGKLLTDETIAQIQYIAQITNPVLFSPLFVEALAARLSARFAMPVTGSREKAKDMYAMYEAKLREARTLDGQEGTPEAYVNDELSRDR